MDDESLTEATRSIVLDIEAMASRLEAAGQIVEAFVKHDEDPQKVCWVETHQRKGFLNTHLIIADLEIAQPLVESLFKPFRTVILTSATLTTNNNFEFMKHRLGVDNNELDCDRVDEAQYSSPFNYAEQAMLIVPRDIPDPNSRDFLPAACEKIWDAVLASRGNAFVLFTSYASLRACAQILEPKLRERRMALFKQGDDDRQTLLKSFRNTENSVLFGTDSFWEGVDVTGEALRCVILYKLPFQVPTDPLVQARTEAITAAGGKAFFEYSVPNAIVKFKQGFGRLIRHKKDRGVIVCLDNRLLTKGYGKMFINSLPPCQKQTTDKGELRKVMEQFYKKTYRLTR